ncbi:hypothetical protein D3C80_2224430 [compost metagenome]
MFSGSGDIRRVGRGGTRGIKSSHGQHGAVCLWAIVHGVIHLEIISSVIVVRVKGCEMRGGRYGR